MKKHIINIFIYCILLILISGCIKKSDPNYSVINQIELNSLLIDADTLPNGWSLSSSGFGIDEDRSFDSAGITYISDLYPSSFGVTQNIYRLKTIDLAKKDYQFSIAIYKTGEVTSDWDFQSEYADESSFSCILVIGGDFPSCQWSARYNRIVIEIHFWMIPARMDGNSIVKIIRAVDKKAEEIIMSNLVSNN
jgi:hypothetical protein